MIALLAPYDKTGLRELALGLAELGYEICSTSGTARRLAEAGLAVTPVSSLTGFPEILDGRVKTLHPKLHGGILARRDRPQHMEELARSGIAPIDVVCVNLYPFRETIARPEATLEEALENIDIGGPALLRAAAKNHPHVLVLVDPADYGEALDQLRALRQGSGQALRQGSGQALRQSSGQALRQGSGQAQDERGMEFRRRLAAKAFQHVASYDTAIAVYLRGSAARSFDASGGPFDTSGRAGRGGVAETAAEVLFPSQLTVGLEKRGDLRYGENPHQRAAVYRYDAPGPASGGGLLAAELLHGLEMSYLNYFDADAAWRAATEFEEPAVVIVKHATPSGIASHEDIAVAYERAYDSDPISPFGGVIAANRPVTWDLVEAMKGKRYDIIVAPGYEERALERLRKRRDLRILRVGEDGRWKMEEGGVELRSILGGVLVQEADRRRAEELELRVATKRAPAAEELADLRFAWTAVKHAKSNAVVVARERATVGIGCGQPNRLWATQHALEHAGERARGAVLASDAFFPFARGDAVEDACKAGVTAIIQPGGGARDDEAVAVCDEYGVAMVFTGTRVFKH
jgi:phosphoribosylaminoimidazolecarboxamide formyltransferase/IMP cyclohydrolase